jgi:hypothetical protein
MAFILIMHLNSTTAIATSGDDTILSQDAIIPQLTKGGHH